MSKIFIQIILFIFTLTSSLVNAQVNPDSMKFSNDSIPEIITDTNKTDTSELNFQLLVAAEKGDTNEVIKLLMQGANINTKSSYYGITPLMYASQKAYLGIVDLLLYNGANVNETNRYGETALMGAVKFDKVDEAELLIRYGAEINTLNKDSVSALMFAVTYDYYIMSDMLIFYGAEINQIGKHKATSLILASYFGNLDIAQLLLNKGADVNHKEVEKFTPLIVAAQNGFFEIVKLLVENNADINIKTQDSISALGLSISNNHNEISKYLISKGGRVDESYSDNSTLMKLALDNYNGEIIKILKSKGAKTNILPYFNSASVGLGFNWNFQDFMLGGNFCFNEVKYGLGINFAYESRIMRKPILLESNNIYYQLREMRSLASVNVSKKFFINPQLNKQKGIIVGIKEAYTFGSYKGTKWDVDNKFLTIPFVGIFTQNKDVGIKIYYEYLDFDTYKVSPHRINIVFEGIINKSRKDRNKNIYWL